MTQSLSGKGRRGQSWGIGARHRLVAGVLFLLPLLSGLVVFRLYGFVYNLYLSFTKTSAFGPSEWVGLANYQHLLADRVFVQAVGNTIKFVVLGVPAIVVVSLLSALLLHSISRGSGWIRTIMFLPAVTMPVAVLLVFAWLFNTDHGLVNAGVVALGGGRINWFGTDFGVTLVFILAVVYMSSAIPMLVILANLQSIPRMYREAAQLDGAGPLAVFRHVTIPLVTPSIFYVTTTNIISMFQMFTLPYVLLPEGAQGLRFGQTIVHHYYQAAFQFVGQRGYAAAISVALLLLILLVTAVNFALQKRWVHYEA